MYVRTEYKGTDDWTPLLDDQTARVEARTLYIPITPGWDVRVQATDRKGAPLTTSDDWAVGYDNCS